jgi:hypothetical protein
MLVGDGQKIIDSSSGLPEKLKILEKVANSHFF